MAQYLILSLFVTFPLPGKLMPCYTRLSNSSLFLHTINTLQHFSYSTSMATVYNYNKESLIHHNKKMSYRLLFSFVKIAKRNRFIVVILWGILDTNDWVCWIALHLNITRYLLHQRLIRGLCSDGFMWCCRSPVCRYTKCELYKLV